MTLRAPVNTLSAKVGPPALKESAALKSAAKHHRFKAPAADGPAHEQGWKADHVEAATEERLGELAPGENLRRER